MIYIDYNLTSNYKIRYSYMTEFPFGLSIILLDDAEELCKYVYDLNGDNMTECNKALCAIDSVLENNGIAPLTDDERSAFCQFTYTQAENCRIEWERTFDLKP